MSHPQLVKAQQLPQKPGVYQFFDASGKILYIGKAKNLRSRVKTYFQRTETLEPSKRIMVPRIVKIKTTVVSNEREALLLESSLIHDQQPPFNVFLKDDKYFKYLKITVKDRYPVITGTRRVTKDGARYFGPYTSAWAVKETLKMLKLFFPFESCTIKPQKPCLKYVHGVQVGPLEGDGEYAEQYAAAIRSIIDFLNGTKTTIIRDFTKAMKEASRDHQFERAAVLRDRVRSLEHMIEKQNVVNAAGGQFDVIALAKDGNTAAVNVLAIRGGRLLNSSNFLLGNTEGQSDATIITSFLERFYTGVAKPPKEIYVPVKPKDATLLQQVTSATMTVPSRGKKRKLMKISEENAKEHLIQRTLEWEKDEKIGEEALAEFTKAIKLKKAPRRIETYDISNIQGTYSVGSMIVFVDGRPEKKEYRKFVIKNFVQPDDFGMMKQMLERRFAHTVIARSEHKRTTKQSDPKGRPERSEGSHQIASLPLVARNDGERAHADEVIRDRHVGLRPPRDDGRGEWQTPDLIIIDGGKGQLSVARKVLEHLGVEIPVISLAKREEEIFVPGRTRPIVLPRSSKALFLIQRMRDEAHRFAITFYRKRHARETTRSLLDDIPGIGSVKRKILIKTFGSVDGIRKAPDNALEKAVGKTVAAAIKKEL